MSVVAPKSGTSKPVRLGQAATTVASGPVLLTGDRLIDEAQPIRSVLIDAIINPMKKTLNISGSKFNMLTVVSHAGNNPKGEALWSCLCDCGNPRTVSGAALRKLVVYSCGCTRKPMPNGHGKTGTAEHNVWRGMMTRCYNQNNERFPYYGGRGITVCDEWLNDFPAFLAHMGNRPSDKHSIDRIDNSLGYMPGNCRWVTQTEQCRNTRSNVYYEHSGKNMILPEWAEFLGLPLVTLVKRLQAQWPYEEVFTSEKFKGKIRPSKLD